MIPSKKKKKFIVIMKCRDSSQQDYHTVLFKKNHVYLSLQI